MSGLVGDLLSNGQAAFYRGRQARDLGIRAAYASGMDVEAIAEAVGLQRPRVEEIVASAAVEEESPAVIAGGRCAHCLGTGRIERARACGCQRPGGVCDTASLAHRMDARVYRPNEECDGWIYTFDFCTCEAGQPRRAA